MPNDSNAVEFLLVGFPGLPEKFHTLVSLVMFLIYNMSLIANGTVIGLIVLKEHLHQPMYIIIGNLALSDLLFDTITLPKMIAKYWFGDEKMSFAACFFQMFCVHFLASVDSFVIMLMAADRYVAICHPLRYPAIFTNKVTATFCFFFWVLASIAASVNPFMILNFPFCGPNKINNCFCSTSVIFPLSCRDVTAVRQIILIIALLVLLVPLALIILSYIIIIITINVSILSENWQKVFYTCTTHLFVVCLYYIPRVFVYLANYVRLILNADFNVLLLCLYTYLPHLANPVIYCLRNKEIKITLGNLFRRKIGINT